jgi:hypothetical protein
MVVWTRRHRPAVAADTDRTPVGIAVGVGATAMVLAAIVAAMISPAHPGVRFGVLAAVVVLFAAVSLDRAALAVVALIGALLYNGFLENSAGNLSWHTDDLWRLMLLVTVGAVGLAIGEGYRFVRDMRGHAPPPDPVRHARRR